MTRAIRGECRKSHAGPPSLPRQIQSDERFVPTRRAGYDSCEGCALGRTGEWHDQSLSRRRMRIVLRLLLIPVLSAAIALALAIGAQVVMPGRGFLSSARHYYALDLLQQPDGRWEVVRTTISDSPDWELPTEGFRVWVEESSMGRWNPARMGAWRARHWTVVTSGGTPKTDLENDSNQLTIAVRAHIQDRLIPASSLWELWPKSTDRTAQSVGSRGAFGSWTASSTSDFSGNVRVVCAAGIALGTFAALRFPLPSLGRRLTRPPC